MKGNFKSIAAIASALSLAAITFGCNQADHKQADQKQNTQGMTNTPSSSTPVQQVDFVGNWKVADGDNVPFYIILNKDGSAFATWGEGKTGRWTLNGNKAQVTWADGWVNFIYKNGNGYTKNAFAPGKKLEGTPDNTSSAEKVANIPPSAMPKTQSASPSSMQSGPSPAMAPNSPSSQGPERKSPTSWRKS